MFLLSPLSFVGLDKNIVAKEQNETMIEIVNRTAIIPDIEKAVGVQGDNLAQTRVFSIDKIVNGFDLSTFTVLIQLQAIYPTHPPYFDHLKSEVIGNKLNLIWNIADHDTSSYGNLYFQIQFSKAVGNETVIYQTIKNYFVVVPTIEARNEYENMPPNMLERYIEDAKAEADRAGIAADISIAASEIATEAVTIINENMPTIEQAVLLAPQAIAASKTAIAKASEAQASATKAFSSEQKAGASEDNALLSSQESEKSAVSADASDKSALSAKSIATEQAANSLASAKKSEVSAGKSSQSELAAKNSENVTIANASNAKASETAAKTSENNALSSAKKSETSAENASQSELNAKNSENASIANASKAKASETAAKSSENNALASANVANEARKHQPYIGANSNWYIFDTETGAYKDTSVSSKGNMQFATFEVDSSLELLMHTTEEYDGADFRLNENGELEVII